VAYAAARTASRLWRQRVVTPHVFDSVYPAISLPCALACPYAGVIRCMPGHSRLAGRCLCSAVVARPTSCRAAAVLGEPDAAVAVGGVLETLRPDWFAGWRTSAARVRCSVSRCMCGPASKGWQGCQLFFWRPVGARAVTECNNGPQAAEPTMIGGLLCPLIVCACVRISAL